MESSTLDCTPRGLWNQQVSAQAWAEKQTNGNYINSFKAAIAEYQAFPIERATYPENYAAPALDRFWM
jgi:hypothetical protein